MFREPILQLKNISSADGREDDGALPSPDARKQPEETLIDREARERCERFQSRNEKLVNGYFGTPDVTFTLRAGEGAYIDLKIIRVNIDPKLLFEYGMTDSEALFVVFHEAEHFRDMIRNPDAYADNFERIKSETAPHAAFPKALHRLFNCVDDILVNKAVMARWKAGGSVKDPLYRKLFANPVLNVGADDAPIPRHRQFMYALLRRAMLPDEATIVDADVEEAIREATFRGEGKKDRLALMTNVDRLGKSALDPEDRFTVMWKEFVPIFKLLYEQDLVDRKPKPGEGKGKGKPGEPGESSEGDPFGADPNDSAIPDPIDYDDAISGAQNINKAISDKMKNDFENTFGVTREDFDLYKRDYDAVEGHIEELSRVFDDVIDRRKTSRRVLRKSVRDGVMLDPRKAAIAVAEMRAGNDEPQVELSYERRETIRNLPSAFRFILIGDGSGSMKGNEKEVLQRKLAVLITEALAEFQARLDRERRRGEDIKLEIETEVRIVADGDAIVKPLSTELSHPDRVKMGKALRNLPGGRNNEPVAFAAIEREQLDSETAEKLRNGELKMVVLFLTDGETDSAAVGRCIDRIEGLVGEAKAGAGNGLVIAGIGFGDGVSAKETYKPNGYYAESFDRVPDIFKKFLEEFLETI